MLFRSKGLSRGRGFALKGAQAIGHVQAAQAGTVVGRATRVAVGRFGGKYGRGGMVSGFGTPSAFTGPSARIYNRISGRIFGRGLSQIRPGGFGGHGGH